MALIGANGAGKSSILRAITGLQQDPVRRDPLRGRAHRRRAPGRDRQAWASPWCRRAGASSPTCRCKDNLLMGAFTRTDKAGIARDARQRARALSAAEGALFARRPARMSRRRAADAGDRPRADGQAAAPAARRALARHRARSSCRTSPARSSPSTATRRCQRAPGRAELAHGALDLAARLCARDRPRRALGRIEPSS